MSLIDKLRSLDKGAEPLSFPLSKYTSLCSTRQRLKTEAGFEAAHWAFSVDFAKKEVRVTRKQ